MAGKGRREAIEKKTIDPWPFEKEPEHVKSVLNQIGGKHVMGNLNPNNVSAEGRPAWMYVHAITGDHGRDVPVEEPTFSGRLNYLLLERQGTVANLLKNPKYLKSVIAHVKKTHPKLLK